MEECPRCRKRKTNWENQRGWRGKTPVRTPVAGAIKDRAKRAWELRGGTAQDSAPQGSQTGLLRREGGGGRKSKCPGAKKKGSHGRRVGAEGDCIIN